MYGCYVSLGHYVDHVEVQPCPLVLCMKSLTFLPKLDNDLCSQKGFFSLLLPHYKISFWVLALGKVIYLRFSGSSLLLLLSSCSSSFWQTVKLSMLLKPHYPSDSHLWPMGPTTIGHQAWRANPAADQLSYNLWELRRELQKFNGSSVKGTLFHSH